MNSPELGSCEGMDSDGYILLNDLTKSLCILNKYSLEGRTTWKYTGHRYGDKLMDCLRNIGVNAYRINDDLTIMVDGTWCYFYGNHRNYHGSSVCLLTDDTPLPEHMIPKAIELLNTILSSLKS